MNDNFALNALRSGLSLETNLKEIHNSFVLPPLCHMGGKLAGESVAVFVLERQVFKVNKWPYLCSLLLQFIMKIQNTSNYCFTVYLVL